MNILCPSFSKPLCAGVVALAAVAAQAQAPNPVLNIFEQILRPGTQQAPQSNATAAGGILNAITGGAATPAAGTAANATQVQDLMRLLVQAGEQIDQPREIEIGRQLAAVLLGSKPLHPDMNLQRYVNQLGRWISLQSPRPDLPWTFAVLGDDGFNAFAAPGGYIFVTKGLLVRLNDEAELAGILAHEITHVVEKHHLKALQKAARAGLLTQVIGNQLTGSLGPGLSAQVLALGRDIYTKGLDQTDEYEADRQGVALAARSGFDPYGLAFVLNQLRTATPDNGVFTLTLSTHPPAQTRLDQLELAMGKRLDALSGKPSVALAQRLGR
jgi:predicted Zn-dependent protease